MKKESIALQLYSVRDALQQDYEGTIRKIAGYGYTAFETAGAFGESVTSARALYDSLGITVAAAHSPLPVGDKQHEVLETIEVLGCRYLVCPWLNPAEYYQDMDGIKRACDLLNEANSVVQAAGLNLVYHNHDFEMTPIEGKPVYEWMLDLLDESIQFELDTYWVQVGGLDPLQVMAKMKGRLPLLHIKDGPANSKAAAMVAVGAGNMDIEALLQASSAEWHIVELDRCDTDMLTAVAESYSYLMEKSS